MGRPRHAYAAPAWSAEQRVGDVGTKAVLLLLANYADEEFSCFPGQGKIAEETEQSVRTVRRQLERLEALGLIKREKRYDGRGKRTSDRYFLQIDRSVNVTSGGGSPAVLLTTGHMVAGSEDLAGQEGTTGQIVAGSGTEAASTDKGELEDNLAGSNVAAGQDATTGHQVSGSGMGLTTGHGDATTGHEKGFTTGHSYGRGTPRRTPRSRTPRSGDRSAAPEHPSDLSPDQARHLQARGIVREYMDWRASEKGKPLLNSSRMYHALVNEYVEPALKAGYDEALIRERLGDSARAGHEWPTGNAWRSLLDRSPGEPEGKTRKKRTVADGNEDHWNSGGSFAAPA